MAESSYELVFTPEADGTLNDLENDPSHRSLLRAVDDVLVRIERGLCAGDRDTKVLVLQVSHRVVRSTPVEGSDWYVIWSAASEEGDVGILYIGPESEAQP